jgi:hypothetical protein
MDGKAIYEGEWKDDQPNGQGNIHLYSLGVMTYNDGSKFEGEFKNGQQVLKS